eukprot:666858-Pleurochrysis_carterae.AAC.1
MIDRSQVPVGRAIVPLIWVYKRKRSGLLKARGGLRPDVLRYDAAYDVVAGACSCCRWRQHAYAALEFCGRALPGYATYGADDRPRICRVDKPVYGMAQAGRIWQRSLFPWLKQFGFRQCESDPCIFTMQREIGNETHRLIIGCYVDDLFTLYSHDGERSLYDTVTVALARRWQVEDEGPVFDLLNVDITVNDGCVELIQGKYIDSLVQTYICLMARPRRFTSHTFLPRIICPHWWSLRSPLYTATHD